MAKFLFTVWPFAGCVHPLVAVAHKLRERGHECGFYTGALYQSLIEGEGFQHFPFQQVNERALDELVFSPEGIGKNWSWTRPLQLQQQLRAFFLEGVPQQFADIQRILATWGGDVVVSDPAMWGSFVLLSELERVPVALCSYAGGCMLPGPDVPPIGLGLPLSRSWFGGVRDRLVGFALDGLMSGMRRDVSLLRQQYGLSPLKGPVINLARRLPLYLLPSCPEYDYNRRDLPSCVRYVGPLQWYPPQAAPAWLDSLLSGQPVIHVTEGTLHYQEPFVLKAAARGLANLPMSVVLTSGGDRDPTQLGLDPLAPNVRVERFVPHNHLLPRTDVMVTTAGGGTVMAGLQFGVPMVLVPTEWDKAENTQRVVEAGAGIRLSPRKCTPQRLRKAVEQVLEDPSYRENVRRLAKILAGYGGPALAASLLEQIIPGRESQKRTGTNYLVNIALGST
jgi:UDP:flavonoid glycosyltransferase YjiC (YdhE family)